MFCQVTFWRVQFEYEESSYSNEDGDWDLPDESLGFSNRATPSLEQISDVKYLSFFGEPSRLEGCDLRAFVNLRQLEPVHSGGAYGELLNELLKILAMLESIFIPVVWNYSQSTQRINGVHQSMCLIVCCGTLNLSP
ncbi:unnamed protein product [Malus baccata var. baccata]